MRDFRVYRKNITVDNRGLGHCDRLCTSFITCTQFVCFARLVFYTHIVSISVA